MGFLVEKIGDERLEGVVGCINAGNADLFKKIIEDFPEYDPGFLWLICYPHEESPSIQKYIEANYNAFHKVLDAKFLKKLSKKGRFESHMWEMIVCDILSSSGTLIPKSEAGSDFILDIGGEQVQVEAIAPDEAAQSDLRSQRPDYSVDSFFELSGKIHDLELPIVLRAIKGFTEKAGRYQRNRPLIIAINTHKTVGLVSDDTYVIRRFLFGLGNLTLTKRRDGSLQKGFEQTPLLNKPGQDSFAVGFFRNPAYSHVSGIIYSSQSPRGLTPGGWGWTNHGITYVPNPLATNKANVRFPQLRSLECSEEGYNENPAELSFKSTVLSD